MLRISRHIRILGRVLWRVVGGFWREQCISNMSREAGKWWTWWTRVELFFQPENGTLCNVDDELGQGVLEATLRTRRWEARCMDFEIGNPVNYKSYQYQQKIRNFQADEKQRESVALVRLPTGLGKTTLMSQNLSSWFEMLSIFSRMVYAGTRQIMWRIMM